MNPVQNHPSVKSYLESVCRKIRSKKLRTEIREEILGHIEDSVQLKIKSGQAFHIAIEETIKAMGSSNTVAFQLREAHRPIYFQWPFLTAASICVCIIGFLILADLTQKASNRIYTQLQTIIEKHYEKFIEDQTILSQESIFDFTGNERDAGPYLNSRIMWSQGTGSPFKTENRLDAVPDELMKRIDSWGKTWFEHANEVDLRSYDFRWMTKIKEFDHWDPYSAGPLRELLVTNEFRINPWTMPIPDYQGLRTMMKLRIMRGIQDHKLLSALEDNRHLIRLIYSNEFIVSALIAVVELDSEREVYEFGIKHGLISKSQWAPLSKERGIRARRAVYGFSEFFDPWVDPKVMDHVFNGKTAKAGMCAALSERIAGNALMRSFYLRHSGPSMIDIESRYTLIDQIINRSKKYCRLSGFGVGMKAWNAPEAEYILSWMITDNNNRWDRFKFKYLARVPVIGPWLITEAMNAVPDYMTGPYERNRLPAEINSSKK